jgi:hypothetical protein
MSFDVQRKVITAAKISTTSGIVAFKWLCPCVFPHVPRKLIGPGKPLIASLKGTFVGFFTGMNSLVCFEVGILGVNFITSRIIASKYSFLFELGIGSPAPADPQHRHDFINVSRVNRST